MNHLRMKAFVAIFIFATLFTCAYYFHEFIQSPRNRSSPSIVMYEDDGNEYRISEHFAPREYIRILTNDDIQKPVTD